VETIQAKVESNVLLFGAKEAVISDPKYSFTTLVNI
jgi:hypothetical protein